MDYFNLSIAIGTTAVLLLSSVSQVYFWQRKEYRLDRMLPALKSGEFKINTITFLLALLIAPLSLAISILILIAHHAVRIARRGIFRPKFTTKATLHLSATLLASFILFLLAFGITDVSAANLLIIIVLLLPAITGLSLLPINAIGAIKKQQTISRASKLIKSLPDLTTIGITGSFGKTSTKHFLSQLVPDVTVSKEHRNSHYPIAQDILEQVSQSTSAYIAEMGAYAKGEIKDLAKLVKPKLGLITVIGNQHLATFGSHENVLNAKWELIEALPADGTAILNGDDEELKKKAATLKIKTVFYSTKEKSDIYADQVEINPESIKCNLHIENESRLVTISLAGKAALKNVLAAVAVAYSLGVNVQEIFSKVERLTTYPQTMEIKEGKNSATIIDDSYSANEQGVINAINHLKAFSQTDKRIVMSPLIELGADSKQTHQRLGQHLKKSGAKIYISGQGVKELVGDNERAVSMNHPEELSRAVTKDINRDTVILLASRLPDVLKQNLL